MIRLQSLNAAAREPGSARLRVLTVLLLISVGVIPSGCRSRHEMAQRKNRENALKRDLSMMRKAIDNYFAEHQSYPSTLQDLVPDHLREIPADPITSSARTWIVVRDVPRTDNDQSNWIQPTPDSGIIDVRSGAEGDTMDDPAVPYAKL